MHMYYVQSVACASSVNAICGPSGVGTCIAMEHPSVCGSLYKSVKARKYVGSMQLGSGHC